jgi:hypothetical protein
MDSLPVSAAARVDKWPASRLVSRCPWSVTMSSISISFSRNLNQNPSLRLLIPVTLDTAPQLGTVDVDSCISLFGSGDCIDNNPISL